MIFKLHLILNITEGRIPVSLIVDLMPGLLAQYLYQCKFTVVIFAEHQGYVLNDGETEMPAGLLAGLADSNRMQVSQPTTGHGWWAENASIVGP